MKERSKKKLVSSTLADHAVNMVDDKLANRTVPQKVEVKWKRVRQIWRWGLH